jgi:hypothetical protein
MQVTSVEAKEGYLFVRLEGLFKPEDINGVFKAVAEATERADSARLLMHCLGTTGPAPTTLERYQIAMRSLELPRGIRFAMVAREEVLDPGRFGQTVARNRGLPFAVFADEAPALAWLLSDEDRAPNP